MVIAMWAVFVAFLKRIGFLSEALLAFLAGEDLAQRVRIRVSLRGRRGAPGGGDLPYPSFALAHGSRSRDGTRRSQTISGLSSC